MHRLKQMTSWSRERSLWVGGGALSMEHVYPRANHLVQSSRVILRDRVSHRFSRSQTPKAFARHTAYRDQVVKIIIDHAIA